MFGSSLEPNRSTRFPAALSPTIGDSTAARFGLSIAKIGALHEPMCSAHVNRSVLTVRQRVVSSHRTAVPPLAVNGSSHKTAGSAQSV